MLFVVPFEASIPVTTTVVLTVLFKSKILFAKMLWLAIVDTEIPVIDAEVPTVLIGPIELLLILMIDVCA